MRTASSKCWVSPSSTSLANTPNRTITMPAASSPMPMRGPRRSAIVLKAERIREKRGSGAAAAAGAMTHDGTRPPRPERRSARGENRGDQALRGQAVRDLVGMHVDGVHPQALRRPCSQDGQEVVLRDARGEAEPRDRLV